MDMKYAEQEEGKERRKREADLPSHSRTPPWTDARKAGWKRIFVTGMGVAAGVLLC
ncbi:MAG TPA: hypothetical protein VKK81_16085 [Candidatus Binatia bacterium]|nr:hypothetical protein [Candidatus Binatia bacterium]